MRNNFRVTLICERFEVKGEGRMTSLELESGGTAEFNAGDVYFIGNATTLIRFAGSRF
jgi:hypothetical protein